MNQKKIKELKEDLYNCEKFYHIGFYILKEKKVLKKVLKDLASISFKFVQVYCYRKSFKNKNIKVSFFIKNFLSNFLSKKEINYFLEVLEYNNIKNEIPIEFVRGEKIIFYYKGKYKTIDKDKISIFFNLFEKILNKMSEE